MAVGCGAFVRLHLPYHKDVWALRMQTKGDHFGFPNSASLCIVDLLKHFSSQILQALSYQYAHCNALQAINFLQNLILQMREFYAKFLCAKVSAAAAGPRFVKAKLDFVSCGIYIYGRS